MAAPGKRSTRTLWLILAVCAAPLVASYTAYYLMPAREPTSYGELLPTQPAPALDGTRADGTAWTLDGEKGHWTIVVVAPAACDDSCAARLYATRQARTMQGREHERLARVWLVTGDGAPSAARTGEHSGHCRRAGGSALARSPAPRSGRHLPRRPARQPGARVAVEPRRPRCRAGPLAVAQGVTDRMSRFPCRAIGPGRRAATR